MSIYVFAIPSAIFLGVITISWLIDVIKTITK